MAIKIIPDYAIHPGEILKDDLKDIGMTQVELSRKINFSTTIINEIISGKRNINADIAIQFEIVFGLPANYWLSLQSQFDETIARFRRVPANESSVYNTIKDDEIYPQLPRFQSSYCIKKYDYCAA